MEAKVTDGKAVMQCIWTNFTNQGLYREISLCREMYILNMDFHLRRYRDTVERVNKIGWRQGIYGAIHEAMEVYICITRIYIYITAICRKRFPDSLTYVPDTPSYVFNIAPWESERRISYSWVSVCADDSPTDPELDTEMRQWHISCRRNSINQHSWAPYLHHKLLQRI